MRIMLYEAECPTCGKINYLKMIGKSVEEWEKYTFEAEKTYNKLSLLDPYAKEFIRSGCCPVCQSESFCNPCETVNQFILEDDIDQEKLDVYRKRAVYVGVSEDTESPWEEEFAHYILREDSLTVNEKLLIIYTAVGDTDCLDITESGDLTFSKKESEERLQEPDIGKIMTLSSKYLTQDMVKEAKAEGMSVYGQPNAYFFFIPNALDSYEKSPILKPFKNLLDYAYVHDCDWLCFLKDGPVIRGL